jgi:hypothetical protein
MSLLKEIPRLNFDHRLQQHLRQKKLLRSLSVYARAPLVV